MSDEARRIAGVDVVSEIVFKAPLPNVPGKEIELNRITYGPSGSQEPQSQAGFALSYVLEGSIIVAIGDGPETPYSKGEAFSENPFEVRAVSRNASNEIPATTLVFLVTDSE